MVQSSSSDVAKYVSPDGVLTFIVVRKGRDVSLGFEGTPWHTHADVLAALSGLSPDESVARFVADLLESRAVVATATVDGRVVDIWIADDPLKPDPYKPKGEVITLRYWDGRPLRA